MKTRLATTLVLGILLAILAFCGFYFFGTAAHRNMLQTSPPELAWFEREFQLTPAEFDQFRKLHNGYLPHCKEMGRRIDEHNERVRRLITGAREMTPELEQALAEGARLRAKCQQSMLAHFLDVSGTMKPEQAKRYLHWVYEKTFAPYYGLHSPRS